MERGDTYDELIEFYGKPLLQFIPEPLSDADKKAIGHDLPKECAVFKIDDHYPGGVIAFSRYCELWHANTGERWIIRHLLNQIK